MFPKPYDNPDQLYTFPNASTGVVSTCLNLRTSQHKSGEDFVSIELANKGGNGELSPGSRDGAGVGRRVLRNAAMRKASDRQGGEVTAWSIAGPPS